MKQAMYYESLEDESVLCVLCPHQCRIAKNQWGRCGVRQNQDGMLVTWNYEKLVSLSLDPIEKKPLRRYKPGSWILSAGTFGCNMVCPFCQNYTIARAKPDELPFTTMTAENLVSYAEKSALEDGNIGLAFTYNEPTVWYEYVLETARLAKKAGLDVVLVSNGLIAEEPLQNLLPYIDAMNIDLKSFQESVYKQTLQGDLATVLRSIEQVQKKVHLEVTTLIVPGMNDGEEEIEAIAGFLSNISPDIPLHISRFFPHYLMQNVPATEIGVIFKAVEIAKKHLRYVYSGNVS